MEVYGDERGHSTKYFEQNLDFPIGIMDISLMESSDGTEFVAVSAEDGGSGQSTLMNVFYAIEKDGLSIADVVFDYWYRDYSTDEGTTVYSTLALDDAFALGLEPNIQLWGSSGESSSGLDMEIEQEEYDSILAKYTGNTLLSLSPYSEPQIHTTGLLPAFEVAVPQVEVNGKILDLEVAPYAYNDELMVPLRDVLEAIGVAVYANADVSVILASTKNDTLTISNKDFYAGINEDRSYDKYNSYKYSFNGNEPVAIDVQNSEGKIFAPIPIIAPLFGATAKWDSRAHTMRISADIPVNVRMKQSELNYMANFGKEDAVKIAEQNGYKYYSITAMSHDDFSAMCRGLEFKCGKGQLEALCY